MSLFLLSLLACPPESTEKLDPSEGSPSGDADAALSDAELSALFTGVVAPFAGAHFAVVEEGENDAANALDRDEDACPALGVSGADVTLVGGCTGHSGRAWSGTAVATNVDSASGADVEIGADYAIELDGFGNVDGYDDPTWTGSASGSWRDPDVDFWMDFDLALATSTFPSFRMSGAWVEDGGDYLLDTPVVVDLEGRDPITVGTDNVVAFFTGGSLLIEGDDIELTVNASRRTGACYAATFNGERGHSVCLVGRAHAFAGDAIEREEVYDATFVYAEVSPAEDGTLLAATTRGDVARVEVQMVGRDQGTMETHEVGEHGFDGGNQCWSVVLTVGAGYSSGAATAYDADPVIARFVGYDAGGRVAVCAYDDTDWAGANERFGDAGCPQD